MSRLLNFGCSLEWEVQRAGFTDARPRRADESAIAGFARYGLESRDGRPRKPDSLYMEARKRPAP
jgi:hypothetical protein